MANINWNNQGENDAENEKPRKTTDFPSPEAQNDYNEGFNNKWWEKGNDDARNSSPRRTDLPKGDKDLVVNYCDGYEDGQFAD